MRIIHNYGFCAGVLAVIATCASAQVQDPSSNYGILPFQTYLGETEDINPGSGGVHINLPLVKLPGRNGHNFSFVLNYNSLAWWVYKVTTPSGTTYHWTSNPAWSSSVPVLSWQTPVPINANHKCYQGNFHVRLWDGRLLFFPNVQNNCVVILPDGTESPDPSLNVLSGSDETGDMDLLSLTSSPSSAHMTLPNGQTLFFGSVGSNNYSLITKDVDVNGNTISYSYPGDGSIVVTDTVGRTITIASVPIELAPGSESSNATVGVPTSVTYPDPSGNGTRTISFTLGSFPTSPHFGTPLAPDPPPGNASLLSTILLANGDRFDVEYNDGYKMVTRIVYPSGGQSRYDYQSVTVNTGVGFTTPAREIFHKYLCQDYGARTQGGCPVSENVTTFTPTGSTGYAGNTVSTVTSPVGDQTNFSFQNVTQQGVYTTQGIVNSGASTPLRTIVSTPSAFRATQRTITLDDGQVSMTQWDRNFAPNPNNVTETREYGYGSGPAGPLVRKIINAWLQINSLNGNQDYTSASIHILDRKISETIQNDAGVRVAETDYEYDNYLGANGGTPIQASGATQHDSAFTASYTPRGNLTATKRWLNTTGGLLVTANTYDDAGNALSATDPKGNVTTFTYADNFADGINHSAKAFVTQTTLPTTNGISHVSKKQYFYNAGLTAAACGENFSGSSCVNTLTPPQSDYANFTYDMLGRLRIVTHGDGGTATTCYSDDPAGPCSSTNAQLSQSTSESIASGISKTTSTFVDGLGQVIKTQVTSDDPESMSMERSTRCSSTAVPEA